MMEWVEVVKAVGPAMGLILFFVWRDSVREKRMSQRMNDLEDYIRTDLKGVATAYETATVSAATKLDSFEREFRRKPCLKEHPQ